MPPPFRFIQALVWKVCVLFGGACPHCAMRRRHLALLRQDFGRSLAARPPLGSSPPNRSRAGRRGRRRVHTRGQRLSRGMVRTPRTPRWMSQMAWDFSASCGRRASSLSGSSDARWVWAWRVILPFPPHRFAAWSPHAGPGRTAMCSGSSPSARPRSGAPLSRGGHPRPTSGFRGPSRHCSPRLGSVNADHIMSPRVGCNTSEGSHSSARTGRSVGWVSTDP